MTTTAQLARDNCLFGFSDDAQAAFANMGLHAID